MTAASDAEAVFKSFFGAKVGSDGGKKSAGFVARSSIASVKSHLESKRHARTVICQFSLGGSTLVKRMLHNEELVGSNPARCLASFSSLSILSGTTNLGSGLLCRLNTANLPLEMKID